MNLIRGVKGRLLLAFALFAVSVLFAVAAVAYFAADKLASDLLAEKSAVILETLIEAEKQTRDNGENDFETSALVSALNLEFLVGKQVPPALAKLAPGFHSLDDGERFIFLKFSRGVPYALCGNLHSKDIILKNVASLLLFCGLAALCAAPVFAIFLADKLARPIGKLAASLREANPPRTPSPSDLSSRADEIGVLARALDEYGKNARDYLEREKFFTSAASHELRTPLTVLSQGLEVLETRIADDRALNVLNRLKKATNDMIGISDALLRLARGEKRPLQKFRVRTILYGLISRYTTSNPPPTLRGDKDSVALPEGRFLRLRIGAEAIYGQEDLAIIALGNLLDNAVKHGAGDIFLDIDRDFIRVRNFPPPDPAATAGAGFGLCVAQKACERMNWRLRRFDRAGEIVYEIIPRLNNHENQYPD